LEGREDGEWVAHLAPPFWEVAGFPDWTGDVNARLAALATLKTDFSYSPTLFCLMLAKIAHGAAVLHRGYGSFEPFLGQLISQSSTEVHKYAGGQLNPTHVDRDTPVAVCVKNREDYITVEVCLFANLDAPVYEVVVGRSLSATVGIARE
jgi:hypothetical protein